MSNNLFTTDATGATRSATADEILDAARTILAHRVRRGAAISNPRHTRDYLRLHLAPHDHEIFAILFLDTRHRVIEFVPLFRGTIDGASVHPREVVKEALRRNAAAVILATTTRAAWLSLQTPTNSSRPASATPSPSSISAFSITWS